MLHGWMIVDACIDHVGVHAGTGPASARGTSAAKAARDARVESGI